jgi:hypothetical protein
VLVRALDQTLEARTLMPVPEGTAVDLLIRPFALELCRADRVGDPTTLIEAVRDGAYREAAMTMSSNRLEAHCSAACSTLWRGGVTIRWLSPSISAVASPIRVRTVIRCRTGRCGRLGSR